MLKKAIDHVVIGVAIAFFLTNVMLFLFARKFSGAEVVYAYILWMVAGGLYGVISLIYDTNLKGITAFILHIASTMALSFATFEIMFRYIFKISVQFSYVWLFLGFAIVYVLVSVISFIYNKTSVKALNEKLKAKKE